VLGKCGRSEEAVAVSDEVVRRFGEGLPSPACASRWPGLMFIKRFRLGALGRSE
jgi:hypothetical protein